MESCIPESRIPTQAFVMTAQTLQRHEFVAKVPSHLRHQLGSKVPKGYVEHRTYLVAFRQSRIPGHPFTEEQSACNLVHI